jgi:hypothetical protein
MFKFDIFESSGIRYTLSPFSKMSESPMKRMRKDSDAKPDESHGQPEAVEAVIEAVVEAVAEAAVGAAEALDTVPIPDPYENCAGHWVYQPEDGSRIVLFQTFDDFKRHWEANINYMNDPTKCFDARYKDAENLSAAVDCDTEC